MRALVGCVASIVSVGIALIAFASSDESTKPASKPVSPFARVAIIGASVSNGFGNGVPLSALFAHALRNDADAHVFDHSEGNLFVDPEGLGDRALQKCLDEDATLVVGVDFLFWFAYGVPLLGKDELERRSLRLDTGLELLESVTCPLVLGDLPDLRDARSDWLSPAAIPSVDVLNALNERVAQWAKDKPHVLVVPMASWVKTLVDERWVIPAPEDSEASPELLPFADAIQADRIHPTALGAFVLAHELMASLRTRYTGDAERLVFDGYAEARARALWPVVRETSASK